MSRYGLRRSRGILRKYQRSQSGVTAVEFAIVAPPFLALMMAIFETGIMLFSEYVIEHGVGKASRMIRTGEVQTANMSKSEFKTLVCGKLAAFLDCDTNLHVVVRSFSKFSDVTALSPLNDDGELTAAATSGAYAPGDPYQVVVVNVYYEWSLFTPGMTYMANMADGKRLLAAGAAFRNEPYASTGS
jgi:Flp pilus assembly protein TadG